MPRVRYLVTGRVEVTARSSIHDTRTVFPSLGGWIELDPAAPVAEPACELVLDMRAFDAGDRLKNWKLRSDLDAERHPEARFRLGGLVGVRQEGERLEARAEGTLAWRGREVAIAPAGRATVGPAGLEAEASFELDVRRLGVTPPRFFVLKVEPVATVTVRLTARAS